MVCNSAYSLLSLCDRFTGCFTALYSGSLNDPVRLLWSYRAPCSSVATTSPLSRLVQQLVIFQHYCSCDIDQLRNMHKVLQALLSSFKMYHTLFEAAKLPRCWKEVDNEDESEEHELTEDMQVGMPVVESG